MAYILNLRSCALPACTIGISGTLIGLSVVSIAILYTVFQHRQMPILAMLRKVAAEKRERLH